MIRTAQKAEDLLPALDDPLSRIAAGILRGTKPTGVSVEYPTRYCLAVSLKIAESLGQAVPSLPLAQADDVSE